MTSALAAIGVLAALFSPGAPDLRFQIPPDARGLLEPDQTVEGVVRPGVPGRTAPHDCWVFSLEPGDDAILSVSADGFDPILLVLPGPVCSGPPPLYVDDQPGRRSDARVAFTAPRNAFAVLVMGRPGQAGRYRLTYRWEVADEGRDHTPSEPERLASLLYADDGPTDFGDPTVVDRVFTPSVANAIKALNAETGGIGLGFDFLVDGQDADITPPDVRQRVLLQSSALVDVRFDNMGRPTHLVFHMRETPGGWRVEDIESRGPDNALIWLLSELVGLDLGVAAARQD